MKLFVGYSKAPEQPQSSARPMCYSHTMTNTGREPATIRIAAYRSSPRYALRHGRRHSQFAVVSLYYLSHAVHAAVTQLDGVFVTDFVQLMIWGEVSLY